MPSIVAAPATPDDREDRRARADTECERDREDAVRPGDFTIMRSA